MESCSLCELPADEEVTADDVDGVFCCRGCLEVYRTLGDVEIDDSDELRSALDADTEPEYPDSAETAYLAVDGMHCSTCELFLETSSSRHEGIYDAEASYAAETIKVVYDPEVTTEPDLVDVVSGMGYRARGRDQEPQDRADMTSRLLVGGLFGMMAMMYYIIFLYPTYFGYDPIVELGQFDGLYLYGNLAVMTAIVLLYTGQPMLRGAYVSVRTGTPNVDLLVTIAALAAYFYSTGRLLVGGTDLYYDVTLVVVLAVTVGNYYEERIKRKTAGLLADLTELQVDEATRADGETVALDEVAPGDELRVVPGERIPVDGTVVEGTAAVDEALVTGESIPRTKRPGDEVRGGTVVTDAPLIVETGPDAQSTLDRVVGLLWDIQASRPGAQRVADKLATIFVPLVLVLAGSISLWLLVTGAPPRAAVLTGLTVLIVSCPCALGLATPLAVASGLQSAAKRGIVVATPALFEHTDDVDTLVFDKTGTITAGEMAVTAVITVDGNDDEVLARAGTLEQYADHPIADAISSAARESDTAAEGSGTVGLETVESHTRGVSGTVDDAASLVGHPDLFSERGYSVPEQVTDATSSIRERGDIPVLVGWDGETRGVLAVGDTLRTEWESVARAVGSECRVVVLTGDDGPAAQRFREHPAVDEVFAGVPPDGKAATIHRLGATGTVAMVGDGSNDAPALAAADVGIALETGTKLATDAADAIVLEGDLQSVPVVFDVATRTNRRIRENLAWAFLYNGIAIPLALTGLLNPLFAALAMATSSLFVVANSARGVETAARVQKDDIDTDSSSPTPAETHHTHGKTPTQ